MTQRLVGVTVTVHLALLSVAVIIAVCMRQRHVSVCMHSAGYCQCTCHDMHKTVAVTCEAVQISRARQVLVYFVCAQYLLSLQQDSKHWFR